MKIHSLRALVHGMAPVNFECQWVRNRVQILSLKLYNSFRACMRFQGQFLYARWHVPGLVSGRARRHVTYVRKQVT